MTSEEYGEWLRWQADVDAMRARIEHDARQSPYARPNRRLGKWLAGIPEESGPFRNLGNLNFDISDQAPRSISEARALSSMTLSTGGAFTVAESPLATALEVSLLAYDGLREAGATEVRTPTGKDLPIPAAKDSQNKGARVRESATVTQADPTFTRMVLGAWTYSSLEVQLPIQLFQDSGYPVEEFLGNALGERVARAQSEEFLTGTGFDQPQGLLGSAVSGVTAASQTAITVAELVSLEHSVNPAYRAKGKFMLHDDTLKALKQLVDTTGRPLWQPGIAYGAPDSILGRPFVISPYMPTMAASAKSVLFGDFSKFFIRTVQGATLFANRERYADKGLLGFILFIRSDGALADAGGNPIKYLSQHS